MSFGVKLTNSGIEDAMSTKDIEISNFDPDNLKLYHYRLRPFQLFRPTTQKRDGSFNREFVCEFDEETPFHEFEAKEYLIVTTIETLYLEDGLGAETMPASTLVDQCFGLNSGKLDPGYGRVGNKRQDFIFGLYNFLDQPNRFYAHSGVANVTFYDSRQAKRRPMTWTRAERREISDRDLKRRRADDDGPNYDDE